MCGSVDEIQKEPKLEFNEFNRKCTDILMLLLFIVAGVASIVMLTEARNHGSNMHRVLYGVDFQGNICGHSRGFEHLKYAAWPLPPSGSGAEADIYSRIKVCVSSCAETNNRDGPMASFFTKNTNTWVGYESYNFYRYCIPQNGARAYIRNKSEQAARTIADMFTTWKVILGAAGAGLLLSYLYVKMLKNRTVRRTMVWGILLITVVGGFLTGYALLKYSHGVQSSEVDMFDRKTAAETLGWIVVGLSVVYLLVIIFMRKRINLAINVIGATACAIDQMWGLILYPFIPFVFWLAFLLYWVYMALNLFSVKDAYVLSLPTEFLSIQAFQVEQITTYLGYDWNKDFEYLFIYHCFYLFWIYQFISYASFYTTSGAIAEWYFSLPNPQNLNERMQGNTQDTLSSAPVFYSFLRSFNHIGTIAFASLIIAIIRFVRGIVMYLDKKTKNLQNGCVRCLCCWVHCCLACCQRCIDYITRNALIYSSITGDNLCTAGEHSNSIIMANLGRAGTVNFITSMVIFIGKVAIALICSGSTGLIVDQHYKDDAFTVVMPMVIVFIMCYVIAGIFLGIFGTAMEAMFFCYVADRDGRWTPNALSEALTEAKARQAAANAPIPQQQQRTQYTQQQYQPQPQYYQTQQTTNSGYGAPY